MATRSTIAKLGKDGIIKAVYCHNDGYLEHNGKVLNEYYRDESKVDELLSHGDISSLNENIGEKLPFKRFYTKTLYMQLNARIMLLLVLQTYE